MLRSYRSSTIGPPFRITELLQLTHLGIPLEHITWQRVTMTSDQWVCIRHSGSLSKKDKKDGTVITVLNLQDALPQTWKASVNSAKMNPQKPLIAVRAGSAIQVYDLESRKCLHRFNMYCPIHYWAWINAYVIAIISDTAVYHWNLNEGDVAPSRMFYCSDRIKFAQLVQYTCDEKAKWFALTGLYVKDNQVAGITQICSIDHNLCQNIDAHCVCFTSYKFKGNTHPSCVLVAASRGSELYGKLHVVELGPHISGNLSYASHTETLEFADFWYRFDFPSSIQVSSELGLIYVATKYGILYILDLETCSTLCTLNICPDVVFSTAFNNETQGIIAISRNGQVLSVEIKWEQLVYYVCKILKKPHVADRLFHALEVKEKSNI